MEWKLGHASWSEAKSRHVIQSLTDVWKQLSNLSLNLFYKLQLPFGFPVQFKCEYFLKRGYSSAK